MVNAEPSVYANSNLQTIYKCELLALTFINYQNKTQHIN